MEGKPSKEIWRIYACAAVLGALALASAYELAQTSAELALLSARYTARGAFIMFIVVVVTGPAMRWWKGPLWTWLARRRRHLGLAFAALMALHLLALGINVGLFQPRPPSEMAGGGVIYTLIALMALTSNDAAQRRMGKWWRRLHWVGVNATLLAFCVSYGGRLAEADYFLTGAVFAPLAFGALVLRIAEYVRQRWS